ncbi:MAG TPA: hypothetical protein VNI55_12495 [Gaiellaceae bacterium]|nr:hypothetical protein [Gaiellaceae bacterium]
MKEILQAASAASAAMQADVARSKLHLRGVGSLPLDREAAAWEITEEQRALRNSRPKTRRWKAVEKLDLDVDRAKQRQEAAGARLQEAEGALARAPEDDARALADWLAAGEKGSRPPASLYERERDRDAARLLVEAAMVEVDRALERRLRHIEGNRKKMIEDARRDVEDARHRLQAHAQALPALRQALLDSRDTLLWAAAYPDRAEGFGFTAAAALGLREPMKRALATDARIEFSGLIAALEEDATAIAEAFGAEQKRQLGIEVPRTPQTEAMWENDPANIAWKQAELKRLRGQLGLR